MVAVAITVAFAVIENIDQQLQNELTRALARLTHMEQIRVIMTHPFFTGLCPRCKTKLQLTHTALGKGHCPACGWMEQSLVEIDPVSSS